MEITPKLYKWMSKFNKSEQNIFPGFLPSQTDTVTFQIEISTTGSYQPIIVSTMTCAIASSFSERILWTQLVVCFRDNLASSSELSQALL